MPDTFTPRDRGSSQRLLYAGAACLIVAAFAWLPTARGAPGAELIASPGDGLVDGQYLDVSFSGAPSGSYVRLRECRKGAKKPNQCQADSQAGRAPGDSQLLRSNSAGAGSFSFVVKAQEMRDGARKKFRCDAAFPCELVLFEVDLETSKDAGVLARKALKFGASTRSCPAPDPQRRVAGSGGTTPAAAVVEWQAETCRDPLSLNFSYVITNSPNGKKAFVEGLSDSEFGISAIPLNAEEKAALAAARREAAHVPIAVGSLAFIYNYWDDLDRCDDDDTKQRITDLRLSPQTLALIVTGQIGTMADPRIAADNPALAARSLAKSDAGECVSSGHLHSKGLAIVGRADNSAATWSLTSWLTTVAKAEWESAGPQFEGGATEIFPAGNGVDLRTGSRAVAGQVRTFEGGQGVGDIPDQMWIGYVDTSVARQTGLPSVAVKNAAGAFVAPTTDSVSAGVAASTLNDDGTVTINYAATGSSNAYPLPVVSYLITDKKRMTAAQADTLKRFVTYAITDGQQAAVKRGYVPLSDELKNAASTNITAVEGTGSTPGSPGGGGEGAGGGANGGAGKSDLDSDGDGVVERSELGAELLASGSGPTGVDGYAASSGDGSGGPVEGGLASAVLGAAGGPAGVVRAIAVFLGVPLLIVAGVSCLFAGPALNLAGRPGSWTDNVRAVLRWRR